jgi:hypothetical protein
MSVRSKGRGGFILKSWTKDSASLIFHRSHNLPAIISGMAIREGYHSQRNGRLGRFWYRNNQPIYLEEVFKKFKTEGFRYNY